MKNMIQNYLNIKAMVMVALSGYIILSCDIIDNPRKDVTFNDSTNTDQVLQKVLLEEFTGHKCGFCPDGTEIAHQLKSVYGNRVVIMSIHAGTFATAVSGAPSYFYEFRTPTGNAMLQEYNVEAAGYPSATLNRSMHRVWGKNQWAAIIDSMVQQPAKIKLSIDHTLDTLSRTLQLTVETKFLVARSQASNLSVYLIETDLVNWQKDYRLPNGSTDISNYNHKDFLRANLTSTWGNVLTTGPVLQGHLVTKTFNYIIPTNVNLDKCKIIAVVNHPTNYGITQVEETDFIY